MIRRRHLLAWALAAASGRLAAQSEEFAAPMKRAMEMKSRAVAAGDQPYGAVVVKDGRIVGEAPSRVVSGADWSAHAEREAIRDAQRRLGREDLSGCILVSTSRPCAACERAASEARIARMIHGEARTDAGAPRR
jgi:tRNA(adenine34) deaminase